MTENNVAALIDTYAAGPRMLREAVAGMSHEDLRARPVPGKWSMMEVVAHIADFEPIYADRIKRCIAEERPTFFGGDPDVFQAGLHYHERDLATELSLVESVRMHLASILRACDAGALQREGVHSVDGPIAVAELLRRITNHIPHHVGFINEKKQALAAKG